MINRIGKSLRRALEAAKGLAPHFARLGEAARRNADNLVQLVGIAVLLYGVSRWSLTATAILGGSGAILVPELRPIAAVWMTKWARSQ